MSQAIYLDYAATTPVDPRVAAKMMGYLTEEFGNPTSLHTFGTAAKTAVELARSQVADLIHANPADLIWTSGATESNNLALKGAAALFRARGNHIVTLKTEHPSVLETCQQLEKQGFIVTYLTPHTNGLIDIEELQAALRPDTILVSVMHLHNEIGVIQDIASIAALTSSRGILFHVDAAQSAGKIPLDVTSIPIDLMSLCAHKIYGPKGVGALYLRRKPRARVAAQLHGGSHEQGMRSGTLATHQIVGMGEAFAIAKNTMLIEREKLQHLRNHFLQQLSSICALTVNGDLENAYPGILNIRINEIKGKNLLLGLPELGASVGSACLSKGTEPSYVLRALGQTAEQAYGGVRFSFGRFTTEADIDGAFKLIKDFFHAL
jgi:cysteine desulfurase